MTKMQNFFQIWPNFFCKIADKPFWDLATVLPSSRNKKDQCPCKGNLLKMSGGRISLMWNKAIEQAREML
jgi:hypothetical protein